jgi:hypothetical protein
MISSAWIPVVVPGLLALVATSAAAAPAASPPPPPPPPPPLPSPPPPPPSPSVPSAERRYASAVIDRPAVVPFGVVLSSNDLEGSSDTMRASSRFDVGLPAGIDAWFTYGRTVSAGGGEDRVGAGVGLGLVDRAGLSVVARAGVDLDAEPRQWTAATAGLAVELVLGRMAARLRPELVRVDLEGDAPPRLTAPLALGLQLTPSVWAQVSADLPLGELRGGRLVRVEDAAVPVAVETIIGLSRSTDVHLGAGVPWREGVGAGALTWRVALGWVIGG